MTTEYLHGADHFEIISFAGGTKHGKVYNVCHKDTGEALSMHVMPKKTGDQRQCNPSLVVETLKIPFTVNLRYSFQTKSRSYVILDSVKDDRKLSLFLKEHGAFNANEVVFLVAEIILAISELHECGASYGHINLDHVYLDIAGHVRLKRELDEAHYWLRNECLLCRHAGTCSHHREAIVGKEAIAKDWTDLGKLMCLLFGSTVESGAIRYGKRAVQLCLPKDAASLLHVLINWSTSPFTAAGIQDHRFFCEINWQNVQKRQLIPPDVFIRTPTQSSSEIDDLNSGHHNSWQEKRLDSQRLNEIQLWQRSELDSSKNHNNHLSVTNQSSIDKQRPKVVHKEERPSEIARNNSRLLGANLGGNFIASSNHFVKNSRIPSPFNETTDFTDLSHRERNDDLQKHDKPKLHETEYDLDHITFVTVESLEKSFREKSQQSKGEKLNDTVKEPQADMAYNEFSGQYQGLADITKRYQRYSTSILTEERQQPTLSTLYSSLENIFPSTSRYIMGYDRALSEERIKEKLMQYSNLTKNERSTFQANNQYMTIGTSVLPLNEKYNSDITERTSPSLQYEMSSSIPVFTRSNSYHGGFQASSLGQNVAVEHGSNLNEGTSDTIRTSSDNGRANFYEDLPFSKPSYLPKELEQPIFNGNITGRPRINDKRSQSLTTASSQESSFQSEDPVGLPAHVGTDVAPYLNQKRSSSWSSNDDAEFLKDYLNRSFESERRPETEENPLRKSWPVGYSTSRPNMLGATPERRQPSLVHRISDNDALQRIKQGAYLQARRDFQMPYKSDFNVAKNGSCEEFSTCIEGCDPVRRSRSFDNELLPGTEEEPVLGDAGANTYLFGNVNVDEIKAKSIRTEDQILNDTMEPYSRRRAWTYDNREKSGYAEKGGFYEPKYNTIQQPLGYYSKPSSRNSETGLNIKTPYHPAEITDNVMSREHTTSLDKSISCGQNAAEGTANQRDQEKKRNSPENVINEKVVNDIAMTSAKLQSRDTETETIQAIDDDTEVFFKNEEYFHTLAEGEPGHQKEGPVRNQSKESRTDTTSSELKSAGSRKSAKKGKPRRTNIDKQKLRKCKSTGNIIEGEPQTDKSEEKPNGEIVNSSKKLRKRANVRKAKSVDHESNGGKVKEKTPSQRRSKSGRDTNGSNSNCVNDQTEEKEITKCESELTENSCRNAERKSSKTATRSVSFNEATKTSDGSVKSPITRKTQSAGAVDSQKLKLSLGNSMKSKDLKIEILPNPKSHHNSHRRLQLVEDERTLKDREEVRRSPRKASLDSSISQYADEGGGVTYLVDRLRVISEGNRSGRNSPSNDRHSFRKSPAFDRRRRPSADFSNDLFSSTPNIVKPTITIQNSTPRSMSPVFDDTDGDGRKRKNSIGSFVSRESSIGSASDLWLDEEEMNITGRRGILCRRSASASSAKSIESVENLRARYCKSPTLTFNSSEEELNIRDVDKQSCNSSRSIDSGLSDIFETSKEDESSIPATRSRSNVVSKSDSGVVKDINGNRTSQSEQYDVYASSMESENLCPRCKSGHSDHITSNEELTEVCKRCHKKQVERKEAIVELIQTEINYGQDLRILKEEFYAPIKNGGILSTENVNAVFLNLQELIDVNSKLCITLQGDLEECITRDDQELESLQVGRVFLENVEFFQAYEVFCTKQRQASELVESLQKKFELLRIFLQVSCKQNSKLRKMDLKSFMTMPVQRIMKYPLLLTRIYRVTPRGNSDREALIQARRKIEEQITKINEIASGRPAKLRKSKSTSALNQSQPKGNHLTRLVAEILDWKVEETQIVLSDAFEVSCSELVNVTNWSRKSMKKPCKTQTILCLHGVLEQLHLDTIGGQCGTGSGYEATNAAVIILKKKSTHRYSLFKEPIMLSQAVISEREDVNVAFEISPISKEPLTFMTDDSTCSQKWLHNLRHYAKDLGIWRARRNAMANIMIQSMS